MSDSGHQSQTKGDKDGDEVGEANRHTNADTADRDAMDGYDDEANRNTNTDSTARDPMDGDEDEVTETKQKPSPAPPPLTAERVSTSILDGNADVGEEAALEYELEEEESATVVIPTRGVYIPYYH